MSTIVTRAGKGSPLTNTEVDTNFTNLNTDKYQSGDALGTPASGVVTNLTGTASININGTVGATTPATGSFTNITGSANAVISVTDNTNAALRITQLGTGNALLVEDSTNPDSTPVLIDANGAVVQGYTAAVNNWNGAPDSIQSHTTASNARPSVGLFNWSNNTGRSGSFNLYKSLSNVIGTQGIVGNLQQLGRIVFSGDDGTTFIRAAEIDAFVDGTPGTNDMPGGLRFSTTADGASSPTERMRITSAGGISFGSAGTAYGTSGQALISAGNAAPTWGTLGISAGGTGQTTAQLAINAFAGAVTSGSYLRGNGTNVVMNTIQVADVPTLNQSTTGSAATLTTSRTIAVTGDLSYSTSFNGSANVTAAGTLATVNATVGSFTNASVTVNAKGLVTAASSGAAPVTSVTGTSPVASSGGATPAISLAASYGDTQNPYASKTANFMLAAPTGVAGVPTFRAMVAADVPTLNQNTTGTASNVTGTVAVANGGTGQTTASAAFNALSPITTAGDLILGSGVNTAGRLGIGLNGYVLTSNGTTASWAAATGGVTQIVAGTNITVSPAGGTGAVTVNAAAGTTLSNDTSTASFVYPLFAAATSGTASTVYTGNAKLLYKPSTGEFQASELAASNGLVLNATTVAASYTIGTGYNAMSVGPVTVASGQSVTVSSGQRWLVF